MKEGNIVNNNELKIKVIGAAEEILSKKDFITPVELLMKMNVLTKEDYEAWRNGKVPYLEKVCKTNLSKLSFIMSELRSFANAKKLKPSLTVYSKWGKGIKSRLRFSKTGDQRIEEHYATHYIGTTKISKEI